MKTKSSDSGLQNRIAMRVKPMARNEIERHFELFGSVIPASTADDDRTRTSYFYRQQAIAWGRMARQWWPTSDMGPLCRRLAKSYLAIYRQTKGVA